MKTMTGGQAVVEALKALGVRHVFGIVSVHNIPIYDAILRDGTISPVGVRHEQGAVHAADGYARVTGRLGVAITSTGPGAANSVSALYEAGFASSPVLMITGQIESDFYGKGKGFLHEAENQLAMLRTVTRRAESVRRAEDIATTIVSVAHDIQLGRPQPGAIEIPVNLQFAEAEMTIPPFDGPARIQPSPAAIAAAAERLRAAHRPLIWAGGGVIIAGATRALQQLAETLNAPVVTSANGRGALPEDHPLCLGPLAGDPRVEPVIAGADVTLAVGTRFQAGATRQWAMTVPGDLIHIDADPGVIGRNYHPAIRVVGDAHLALTGILESLGEAKADPEFTARTQAARDEARAAIRKQIGPDYEAIMDTMRELLPRDGNIVRDATVPAYLWGNRLIPILAPRTSLQPTSAAIGPGLPLAIGAAIGSGKKTALIQGDGGLMLSIGELATAAQHRVPVIICVFNDQGYGILRMIQATTFEGRQTGVDLTTPDFAAVARAMGMHGETVRGVDEFKAAYARAMAAEGPVLLDIDMSVLQPMISAARPQRRPA
jgi:acetolactate synthase-1/2/3 large subunit